MIPGDAHDEVTRACQRAFYTKPANPDDVFTPAQTSCQLFMNIRPWNSPFMGRATGSWRVHFLVHRRGG